MWGLYKMIELTAKEIKWLKDVQKLLNKAPSRFCDTNLISSYTIGDNDVVIYDSQRCESLEESYHDIQGGSAPDKCCCVYESGAELFSLNFPFFVESTAG
jgi:hypothetical protein